MAFRGLMEWEMQKAKWWILGNDNQLFWKTKGSNNAVDNMAVIWIVIAQKAHGRHNVREFGGGVLKASYWTSPASNSGRPVCLKFPSHPIINEFKHSTIHPEWMINHWIINGLARTKQFTAICLVVTTIMPLTRRTVNGAQSFKLKIVTTSPLLACQLSAQYVSAF